MPRIRTVKPEFFTSESMAKCSPWARLLAIGLMQHADSHGRMKWVPRQILGNVFPWDEDVELGPLADELEACGFLVRYEVDGSKYAEIPAFRQHQRLSGKEAETDSSIPEPPRGTEGEQRGSIEVFPVKQSGNSQCPGKGTGKGNREREGGTPDGEPTNPSGPPPCPHQEIVDLYHEVLPELTHHKTWDGARADNLRARWRSDAKRQSLDYWRKFFEAVRESPFLMGQIQPRDGGKPFAADLEWLVKPQNFNKVIDGKYHDGSAA